MCRWKQRKSQQHDKNPVHFLDGQDELSDSFSDTETSAQVYALDSQSNTTTINIANVPIQVIIDSSASCNVLNTADSEKLAICGLKLCTCNRTLFPYNSQPLKVTQCLVADVQFHDGPPVSTEFLILPGSQSSLLGRETAESLQINTGDCQSSLYSVPAGVEKPRTLTNTLVFMREQESSKSTV